MTAQPEAAQALYSLTGTWLSLYPLIDPDSQPDFHVSHEPSWKGPMGSDGTCVRCSGCAQAVTFQAHITLSIRMSLYVGTSLGQLSIRPGPSWMWAALWRRYCWRSGQDIIGRGSKQELSSQDDFLISESGPLANVGCLGGGPAL